MDKQKPGVATLSYYEYAWRRFHVECVGHAGTDNCHRAMSLLQCLGNPVCHERFFPSVFQYPAEVQVLLQLAPAVDNLLR